MKKLYFAIGLLAVLAVSCTMTEIDPLVPEKSGVPESFYATIEDQPGAAGTRTYTEEDLMIHWNKEDRITVFNNNVGGIVYFFTGDEGDLGGGFDVCGDEEQSGSFIGGTSDLNGGIFAVYPHRKDTKINASGTITYTFPDIQTFDRNHSFGKEANVMVAKTAVPDRNLRFKNVGGYLAFKLYGENVSVSSVILTANHGEALAGKSTIDTSGDVPVVSSMTESTDEIRLYCKNAVTLGATEADYTEFIFVLPPVTFSAEGFTITVLTSDGYSYSKSAPMSLTIERNKIKRMAAIDVNGFTKTQSSADLGISSISLKRGSQTYTAKKNASDGSFMLTIPTETAFSALKLGFALSSSSGTRLMANGEVLESGVTPVDASAGRQVELTVCRNGFEKRHLLKVRNTGLPVVRITTEGFTLTQLQQYKNSLQTKVGNVLGPDHRIWLPENIDTGEMRLPNDDGSVSDEKTIGKVTVRIERADGTSGIGEDPSVYEVETQIKGRGNYTWIWEKKPYALKLKDKIKVLDMPAHKRWILLANWRDRTLLRNDATFWLSKQCPELPYTVRGEFVELEFNGEHRGNYYLCEQIKIDKNRVNIKKLDDNNFEDLSGGYLMEIDSYWDEANKFKSDFFNLKYMFKEPDKVPSDEDWNSKYQDGYAWMQNYINKVERRLKTRSTVANKEDANYYGNYLDVNSAISFMLINELSGNRDYFQDGDDNHKGPHSTYLFKDKGGKLFFGPGWDFDYETYIAQSEINKHSENGWRGFTRTGYYYHYLRYDPDFVEKVKTIWNERKTAFSSLPAHIQEMVGKISLSQQFDEGLWPYKGEENRNDNYDYYEGWYPRGALISFSTAISRMIRNFGDRLEWIDDRINGNETKGIPPLGTTDPEFSFEDSSQWPQGDN